jgi:hypothetical protein
MHRRAPAYHLPPAPSHGERSIAWLIGPKGRGRKLRYRGTTMGDLWLHHRMAALNLRRLLTTTMSTLEV